MNDDIPKSISQGGKSAEDAQDNRIRKIADELQRLCRIYEEKCGESQKHVTRLDIEFRVTEKYAKEHHLWIEYDDVFELGIPGPSGNENDTYVGNEYVYKVNNLLNSRSIVALLLRVELHNKLFPETAYRLYGFTGFASRSVYPILQQHRIEHAEPATQVMIDTYMAALGFQTSNDAGHYTNAEYEVWDLLPRNVLADKDGDIYVVDAEIKSIEPND